MTRNTMVARSGTTPDAARSVPDEVVKVEDLKIHFALKTKLLAQGSESWVKAVDGVSFAVGAEETLGLVGESGCGKSTAGRGILQLNKPTSGRVYFEGREVTGLRGAELRGVRERMQMVFQDPYASLNPRMKVGNFIAEPLRIQGMRSRKLRFERVRELLSVVGLEARHVDRYPHEFSGGQLQRLAIARALAGEPRFIVCDEPTSSLDVSVQAQIVHLLRRLQREFSLSYLFISHDLAIVRQVSDRVGVMYVGKLVELSGSDELYERALHPYTRALLSAVPVPDPRSEYQRGRIQLPGSVASPVEPPSGCRFHPRCPLAREICKEEEPELSEVRPGHFVACHFWHEVEDWANGAEREPSGAPGAC